MPIVLEHVTKRYRQTGRVFEAVRDVSLTLQDGEFVCVVGPSGCGKSTLLSLIAGLDRPDEGRVLVNGAPVERPGRDRIMVFQEAALFPWLTVLGNVAFGLRLAGISRAEREGTAMEYVKLVHLGKFAGAYPYQLSGGMRQRAAIARALALQPKVLLMDEPFAALDAQTRSLLQEELLELWQQTRKTVLFVTHNVREATGLADRVYEMSARPGRIKREYRVDATRPRTATDPRLLSVQRRILDSLGEEVAKVMQEDLGEALRLPSQRTVGDDPVFGMHI